MVKRMIFRLMLVGAFALMAFSGALAQDIIPTPYMVFFKGTVMINGSAAPVGTIINAFDPDGVNNGRDTVNTAGIFGYFPVYGDDLNTPAIDEGAGPGNAISFTILGLPATVDSGYVGWDFANDTSTAHLSVSGVTVGLELVDPPSTGIGQPRDTVRFSIGVHNTGNIIDFYGISVDQSKIPNWQIIYPPEFTYNRPDSVGYVYFDVVVPNFPGDPALNTLTYTVYSMIDPAQEVSGMVDLNVEVLDAEDPDDLLPGGFALYQNYPNPFNPTTTIAFTLPRASVVRLEIFNTLGRLVDELELGALPVGDRAVEYDASALASGVYLYRVVTDFGAESRKMVLVR